MSKRLSRFIVVMSLLGVAAGLAQGSPYIRVAYWDSSQGTAWAGDGGPVRDALAAIGYQVVNAAELKTWMDDRIADRRLSVVVMCRDVVPDTVAETQDANCTIRRYLDAGGKVVWYSDWPFYYRGTTGTTWGSNGAVQVLGFNASTGPNDQNQQVTFTEAGIQWGLVTPWSSLRPTSPTVTDNLTVLATDNNGNAAGWVKHYLPGDTFRGFVRIEDHSGGPVDIQNLIAVAEYAESINTASGPAPESEAIDVRRDVVLSWTAGESAVTHDVYFGTSFDDVNAASRGNPRGVLLSQSQTGTTFDPPGLLDFGTTYYWRIDEVNGAPDFTVFKGDVWSFTAEPFVYPVANVIATSNVAFDPGAGPENTINGSGLDAADQHSITSTDMWLARPTGDETVWIQYEFDSVYKLHEMLVWNYNVQFELLLGFGLKDVTIEYSENGTDWSVLGDVQFNQGTARATYTANTTVDLQGVAARFVRLNVISGWGMMPQYGLSEVRFLYIPVQAREPQPADGAIGLSPDVALSWRTGREAAVHEVYLSTSRSAVENGTALVGTVATSSYTPATVEFGSRYYWKIDEVNDTEAISTWAGPLWTFVTQEYATIEGFETYTDNIEAGEAIFDTWLDGWVNSTGSTVGYLDTPFAERTIVRSGRQSMPLQYDNGTSPFYSETERTFDSPQNWTGNGANTLRLFVAGRAPAFLETAGGTVLMNAIGNDIWDSADQFRYAYKNLSGNGSITARVDMLDISPDIWVKAGVMIRQNAEAGAINVFMAMTGTGGGGSTFQQRMTAGGVSVSQHTYADGPFTAPYWVRVTREGNTLRGYTSPDGQNWTQRGDTITLAMTDPVLIGLALTSHNVNQATSAQFSNVAFTGNVTGAWQVAEVGAAQPEGNAVVPLYVVLEDATGQTATVVHPDEMIVARSGWSEWAIPYSDLAGVNVSRVRTMYIGLGSRNAPTAGGSGLIYIDDIGYGKPFPRTEATDVTAPGDVVQGVPDDGDWPAAETPNLAIDNDPATKFLHFKGETEPTGIRVTPSVGATVVTGLTLTTANDAPERDPVAFELYGSNDGIDGPYTLIATGDVPDFAGAAAWPRFTGNATPIEFDNDVAYEHYQLLFTAVRDPGSANSMQIAEIELLAVTN
ncbi:discoidin domain-containing protein [Anaerobaca lacustris]|uniref:Discoidin domain-containing protein n=1 Tax=Anaerobaca lacustris TaxID=3044600 RepID=A0AAW6U4X5_9BACT|nr:discoidin domain-containing protein [Sedimentisphaerales bacterium M17dextr]